ncbi:hypothetical protein D3C76_1734630 [compost metagenome]
MHDQAVAVPVWYAGQIQPFVGAGEANLLPVNTQFLAEAQGHLAVAEHLQFVASGGAGQFIGDHGR